MTEIRKFCMSQDQLGSSLKSVTDMYFNNEISNQEFVSNVKELLSINKDKFYANDKVSVRVERILGKRRLDIVMKAISQGGNKKK